jgi:putative transposase
MPTMGSIGDCYDNAVIESFWGRVQTELLNRQRWRTRIELANALFEYQEIFHNRRRRHSSLGMLTPIEYELRTGQAEPRSMTAPQQPDSGKPRAHHQSPNSPGRFTYAYPEHCGEIWSAMSQGDDPRLPAEDRMGRGLLSPHANAGADGLQGHQAVRSSRYRWAARGSRA